VPTKKVIHWRHRGHNDPLQASQPAAVSSRQQRQRYGKSSHNRQSPRDCTGSGSNGRVAAGAQSETALVAIILDRQRNHRVTCTAQSDILGQAAKYGETSDHRRCESIVRQCACSKQTRAKAYRRRMPGGKSLPSSPCSRHSTGRVPFVVSLLVGHIPCKRAWMRYISSCLM